MYFESPFTYEFGYFKERWDHITKDHQNKQLTFIYKEYYASASFAFSWDSCYIEPTTRMSYSFTLTNLDLVEKIDLPGSGWIEVVTVLTEDQKKQFINDIMHMFGVLYYGIFPNQTIDSLYYSIQREFQGTDFSSSLTLNSFSLTGLLYYKERSEEHLMTKLEVSENGEFYLFSHWGNTIASEEDFEQMKQAEETKKILGDVLKKFHTKTRLKKLFS